MQGKNFTPPEGGAGFSENVQSAISYSNEADFSSSNSFGIKALSCLWAMRFTITLITLLALLVSVLAVILYKYNDYSETYEYPVSFTFEGVNRAVYPNETPFSISDMLSPLVLKRVYNKNDLEQHGITLETFRNSVSVTAYTPDRKAIEKKYDALFDSRKSTLADIEKNQREMNEELVRSARSAALLRYTNEDHKLPKTLVESILVDIASTWSNHAIEERGVLQSDLLPVGPDAFDPELINGFGKIAILRTLKDRLNGFENYLAAISNVPGGKLLVDQETSLDVAQLQNEVALQNVVLREVAASWSSEIPGTPEAGRLNINLYSGGVFREENVGQVDYLIAIDRLEQNILILKSNLDTILDRDFGGQVKDPQTSMTAFDIDRILSEIREFKLAAVRAPILQLGIAQNPELLQFYYRTRIAELSREKRELNEKAKLLLDAMAVASNSRVQTSNGDNAAGTNNIAGSAIPQFGDSFLDRLLSLAEQNNGSEFREKLAQESVNFSKKGSEIESQLLRLQEYLNLINSKSFSGNSNSQVDEKQLLSTVQQEIESIKNSLIEYSGAVTRISQRLKYAETAHAIIEDPENPVFDVGYYLRDEKLEDEKLANSLEELGKLTLVAQRLSKELLLDRNGKTSGLFTPAGGVSLASQTTVNMRNILFVAGITLAAFLLSVIYALGSLVFARRNSKA